MRNDTQGLIVDQYNDKAVTNPQFFTFVYLLHNHAVSVIQSLLSAECFLQD